jgi:two-component system response regulator HydG
MAMQFARILLVGPRAGQLRALEEALRDEGHSRRILTDASRLYAVRAAQGSDVQIVDARGQGPEWAALTGVALADDPTVPEILIADTDRGPSGVRALEEGVFDILTEPFSMVDLDLAVRRALRYRTLLLENRTLRDQSDAPTSRIEIVGSSPAIRLIVEKIRSVAESDSPILITGEPGSGKGRVARAIHDQSPRREHPFTAVDCSAIGGEHLFCSGHAPTSADIRARKPILQEASRGTLFLEHIGSLEPPVQESLAELLAMDDEGRGGRPADLHPRLVASAEMDLEAAVERGTFHRDLFERLSAVQVRLPPLRARGEDLVPLVYHFLRHFAAASGEEPPTVSPEVWVALGRCRWPGNVRQLKALAKEVIQTDSDGVVTLEDVTDDVRFPRANMGAGASDAGPLPLNYEEARIEAMRRFRIAYLRRLLDVHEGNVSRGAATAGVSRRTLHRWLAELELGGAAPTRPLSGRHAS